MIQIDMPMPDNCLECRFNSSEFGYCNAMPIEFVGQVNCFEEDGRPEWCPLKAQEPVEPYGQYSVHTGTKWIVCGACEKPLCMMKDSYRPKYCPECGRMVKWHANEAEK